MRRSSRIAIVAGLGLLWHSSVASAQYNPNDKIPRIQQASRWLGIGYSNGNFAKARPTHQVGGFAAPGSYMPGSYMSGMPTVMQGQALPPGGTYAAPGIYDASPMTEGGQQGEWSVGGTMRPGNVYSQPYTGQSAPGNAGPSNAVPGAMGNPAMQPGGPTPAPKLNPVPKTSVEPKASEPLPPPTWLQPYLKDKAPAGAPAPMPPAESDDDLLIPDLPGNAPSVNLSEEKSPSDQPSATKPAVPPPPPKPEAKPEPKPAAGSDDDDSLIRLTPQPRLRAANRPAPRR
ncbi:MAG: hypothetical protein U0892_12420 [Pirellulales bacterium]